MRTLLLVSLLGLSFGLTALSLFAIRVTMRGQIHRELTEDLDHSKQTFLNLQRQRREMLERESALLADLPSLKALMTTEDARTIQDGGIDFWRISGADLLQLYDTRGRLVANYRRGDPISQALVERSMQPLLVHPRVAGLTVLDGALYESVAQPLRFGPREGGSPLGYVVIGYAVDSRVAGEVREAAAAEVAFTQTDRILVSTLDRAREAELSRRMRSGSGTEGDVRLGREDYLAASIQLTDAGQRGGEEPSNAVQLVVLKSFDQASGFFTRLNRWLLGLGAVALLVGALLATSISRRVTQPLEALATGASAIGRGEFNSPVSFGGTAEVHQLACAFDRMQVELVLQQRRLVDSERLATIGRMASSISHDLRHYLSAMYANAEFLSLDATPQPEREELIQEVQAAVHGMTDLLDSLLVFSQTGHPLHPAFESVSFLVERSASLVRSHPDARGVELRVGDLPAVEAWVDGKKLGRAVFNLLLNGCQAARHGGAHPLVELKLIEDERDIRIVIEDNGRGVPVSLQATMFEPFVSRGKESGTGLGLTLALHIAQEHGGCVVLEESMPGKTIFAVNLSKGALEALRPVPDQALGLSAKRRKPVREHEGTFL